MVRYTPRALAVALAACALVAGIEACIGEDPEPSRAADIADAAAPAPDVAVSVPEAGGPSDTGAPDLAATGCARFVDATSCDDFDGVDPFSRWSLGSYGDGGSITRADGGLSAPFAIATAVRGGPDPAGAYLKLAKTASKRVRVRGDFRIPAFGGGDGDYVMLLSIVSSMDQLIGVRVISFPKSATGFLSVVNQGSGQELASREFAGVSFQEWTSVDVELALQPDVSASLQLGASKLAAPVDASAAAMPANVTITAGIPQAFSVGTDSRVLVDDLAVWLE